MKFKDALAIRDDFHELSVPSADEEFAYTEAMAMLIESTGEPKYMAELAWFYCDRKRFDLEEKYLTMAAECGFGPAFEELGYMYYFGQNGVKDYRKAFECFTKGAEPDRFGNEGSLWCRYKLADMYRFGCFVEKDEARYREMIEEAYGLVKSARRLSEPYPEIAYRLAGIRAEQGESAVAVALLRRAKAFLAERLSYDAFWGHIEVMGRIVRLLYELTPFDEDEADFYDLFHLTRTPGRYGITRAGKSLVLDVNADFANGGAAGTTAAEAGTAGTTAAETGSAGTGASQYESVRGAAIECEGRFYRDFADLCGKMKIDGRRVTELYDEFYEVRKLS